MGRCRYIITIVKPTSVHIPKPLLDALDARARKLGWSRNRFIVRALERELERGATWSPGFFERLERIDPDEACAVDEMLEVIRARRTRKAPRRL
jgi:hypothetical protein